MRGLYAGCILFSFSVTDGTTSVSSETLTVNLNDINDEPPVFSPASYDVDVHEGTAQGKKNPHHYLSYNVAPGSEITPCIKFDKPLF